MPFSEIVSSSRRASVSALVTRASLFNRLAKAAASPCARRRFYAEKTAAVSRLIVLGAVVMEEVLPARGLLTVGLPNGRYLHVPIDHLQHQAKQVVASYVQERVMALCA